MTGHFQTGFKKRRFASYLLLTTVSANLACTVFPSRVTPNMNAHHITPLPHQPIGQKSKSTITRCYVAQPSIAARWA